MSQLVGRPDRVAFEFMLTPVSEDHRKWLFGRLCLWAGGRRIGRYDEDCAMTVALATFPEILAHAGRRSDPGLMRRPTDEAFTVLYDAVYGNDESRYGSRAQHFLVSSHGFDYFDGWTAFLIEDRLSGRLIWRSPDRLLHEVIVDAGEFDTVLGEFVSTLARVPEDANPQR